MQENYPKCLYCGKKLIEVQPFYRNNKKTSSLYRCDHCEKFFEIKFDKDGNIIIR